MLKTPVSVALKASLSLEPAVVDLMENEPVNLRVPDTPLYLPRPPVTLATPFTLTEVGALSPAAQAWDEVGSMIVSMSLLPEPTSTPLPVSGSHVLAAVYDPEPDKVLVPR